MSILLISNQPLQENAALFENSENEEQNLGDITWGNPYEDEGEWFVSYEGLDAAGATIETTTQEVDEADTINPTKLFWALVRLAGEILCPECGPGY